MLEKLMYSMLRGNIKTKIYLWAILILGVGAALLIVTAFVLGLPMFGLGGVGLGLLGLIVSQSVSLKDLQKQKKKKTAPKKKSGNQTQGDAHSSAKKEQQPQSEESGKENTRKEKERAKAQYLASMDAKKLKKLLKEHQVNQIHVKVMIDSFPAQNLEQVPAFMWKTDTMLHFMLLSGKAVEFEVPLENIKNILLVKNVPADPDADYKSFQYTTYITKMFRPYLPEYFEVTNQGKLEFKKNTFRIEPGIYLTNTSVANLRRVLLPGVAFVVDDQVVASRRFNEYFKEVYRSSLLCKNNVITLDEYKEHITQNLDAMLDGPVPATEFANTLSALNKYHLIQKSMVAVYYQKYRERNRNGGNVK
ncbi:MAG: hypothetical protein LUH14_00085 [Clostridiaceae bacterium]|nr:hypothetical protein [Clostridiaceae bacterium]